MKTILLQATAVAFFTLIAGCSMGKPPPLPTCSGENKRPINRMTTADVGTGAEVGRRNLNANGKQQ